MRLAKALPLLALLLLASPAVRATDQPDAAALAKARELVDASMVPGSSDQMVGAISGSVAQLILSVNPAGRSRSVRWWTPISPRCCASISPS